MRKLFHCFLLVFTLMLSGCFEEKPVDVSNPEIVAVAFFDALYNQKDIEQMARLSSPQLARIILHYKSPEAVARHLFNMHFDTVEIKPDSSGVKVREQFKDEARIIIYFEGVYSENKLKEVKRLHMIQLNGTWVVNKILKDPF